MSYWTNKVAIVTGGSAGLGKSIAAELGKRGAEVVIVARSVERLESVAEALRSAGAKALAIAADLTQQADVERLFANVRERFGRLDLLVNNAGRSARGAAIEVTPEDFQRLWEINFLSVVRCTRAAMSDLLAANGHLVNIGSLASKSASLYVGAYPATKFALAAYSQQLRLELGPKGLHVLLACPGPIARDEPKALTADELEKVPESARKPGAGLKSRLLDPEWLSRKILSACERRKAELIYPTYARWYFAISQLSANWGDFFVRRFTSHRSGGT